MRKKTTVEKILTRIKTAKNLDSWIAVSNYLGVQSGTLSAWKRRNSQSAVHTILYKCRNEFHEEYLLEGTGDPFISTDGKPTHIDSDLHVDIASQNHDNIVSPPAVGLPAPVSRRVEVVSVPVYGRVPAGTPSQFVEEVERLGIPGVPERTFGLIVSGSSMLLPDGTGIRDGEYALCVSNLELEPQHNDIVVVNDEYGDSMLKRLKINKDGGFELVSDNPAYQRIIPNSGYSIVGVVIETWFRTVHKRYR